MDPGYREVMPGVRSRLIHCDEHVVVIENVLDKNAHVPRHSHESLQISFCSKGLVRLTIGSETVTMRPGDYQVIPPGVEHEAYALEESVIIDVNTPFTRDRRSLVEKLGGCRAAEQ